MVESMKKFMKVGLIHFMAYPNTMKGEGPIEETVKKICTDSYFDAIEVTWIKDPAVRTKIKKLIETSHMTVAYGGQPGAVGFGFLSGKYEEATKEKSYQALVKSTSELCEYAKSKGDMKVALEVFDYDIDKKSIIGPVALAKRFAEEMRAKYDNFGLMVDLSHIPMIHETIEENLLPIKDYIIHAHMGNTVIKDPSCEAYGDTHPRFGFPNGENDVDELVEYLRTLIKIGFISEKNRPIVSFEVKPWGDEDPDVVVANAKRTLDLAWARV